MINFVFAVDAFTEFTFKGCAPFVNSGKGANATENCKVVMPEKFDENDSTVWKCSTCKTDGCNSGS